MCNGNVFEGTLISVLFLSIVLFFFLSWLGVIAIIRNGGIGNMPEKLNFQRNECSCRERPMVMSFFTFLVFNFFCKFISPK